MAWELQRQMVRAAASIGANLAERRGVITRSEFTYKASLALREAHETCYWLTRIVNADLLPEARLAPLMEEGHQIVSILTATVKKPRSQGPGK